MNSCRSSVENASGSKFPRRSYDRVSAPRQVGDHDRRPRTRERHLGVPAVGERVHQRDRPTALGNHPDVEGAVQPDGGRRFGVRAVDGLQQRGACGRGGREQPRAAEARHGPGRSNSTDPLGTWTTSGPASVPRSRVSRGTVGWPLPGCPACRRRRPGPPRTTPRPASSTSGTSHSARSSTSRVPPSLR